MSNEADVTAIPSQLLIAIFANARGIEVTLREFAAANGFLDFASYKEVAEMRDIVIENLHKAGKLANELPPGIRSEIEAIAAIVDDHTGSISHGDYCRHLMESGLEERGERGWREVLRLTRPVMFSWAKPTGANTEPENTTIGPVEPTVAWLIEKLRSAEGYSQDAARQRAKVTGPLVSGSRDSYYMRTSIDYSTRAHHERAAIAAADGVELLRAQCDAGGEPWGVAWVRKMRGRLIVDGRPSEEVDAMTVAAFGGAFRDPKQAIQNENSWVLFIRQAELIRSLIVNAESFKWWAGLGIETAKLSKLYFAATGQHASTIHGPLEIVDALKGKPYKQVIRIGFEDGFPEKSILIHRCPDDDRGTATLIWALSESGERVSNAKRAAALATHTLDSWISWAGGNVVQAETEESKQPNSYPSKTPNDVQHKADQPDRESILGGLTPAKRNAYRAYEYAERQNEKRLEDKQAYQWLDEY